MGRFEGGLCGFEGVLSISATLSLPKMHKTHLIAVGFCVGSSGL